MATSTTIKTAQLLIDDATSATPANSSITINYDGLVIGGDLATTPIYATFNQSGLSTTNPNGLQVLSPINMNGGDINLVANITNNQGDININSGSDFVSLTGAKINLTANSEDINLTATGGVVNISNSSLSKIQFNTGATDPASIYQDDTGDLYLESNSSQLVIQNVFGGIEITSGDYLNIDIPESINITSSGSRITLSASTDVVIINTPTGVYVNNTGSGDGVVHANLSGTASYATSAESASTATTATTTTQVNTTGIASGGGAYSIPFVTSAVSASNQTLYTDSNSHLTFNPTTNQLNATGTITNGGLTMNGSASQFLINNNSAVTPAISAPNALLVNFPSATITASVFSGALSGNSTTTSQANGVFTTSDTATASNCPIHFGTTSSGNQATKVNSNLTFVPTTNTLNCTNFSGALSGTATNSTNASITSDNTSGTYYIPFTKTSGTGNKPLFQDDTTGPLTYNPSTGNMSAISYTITGTPSTASVASTFGQVGLVYLSTSQFSVTGSASNQNFSVASIFNSTYQNYRVVINSATQVSFTNYPTYSLAGFLGSGVPTTASLFGNEQTTASTSTISAVYTGGATLSSSPLQFAVSSLTNKQVVLEVEGVGFANTATNVVGLKCKSFYGNPGVSGYSDRNIVSSSLSGATITGLTIQQSSLGVGNNMTLQFIVYGYNLI